MKNKELEYDILKELFNISVGKAASMLSEIINKKIILDVPDIKILSLNDKGEKLLDLLPTDLDGTLMVSSISFKRQLTGKANLIFPAKKMQTFINLCLNQEDANKCCDMDFTDIDFDVIKEIGNIILNSIIGEIGNSLSINLDYTLPEVKVFGRIDFEKDVLDSGYMHIFILYITFKIDCVKIDGAVVIDLTLNSLNELKNKVGMVKNELCK